jgi:two-component system, NtrC family, response regulator HydG
VTEPEAHPLQVLVVDDNRSAAEAAALLLEREGHEVEVRFGGQAAIDCMAQRQFDLVLTDLRMDEVDGLAVVRAARSSMPPVDAIVFTAYGSVEVAVEAMRLGAVDFLTKPLTASQLLRRVREYRSAPSTQPALVGESAAMTDLRASAVKLSRVGSTVLVVGETGTGRRHLARWLHYNGPDGDRELLRAQPGVVLPPERLAQAGTILVPGVDTWSTSAQRSLLRQLDGLEPSQSIRVVATASHEAERHVASGALLPELYFRLAVLVVRIPPLRERPADINPLLDHFLATAGRAIGKSPPQISLAVRVRLAQHDWPGNALQLANIAERAIVLGVSALDFQIREPIAPGPSTQLGDGFSLSDHMGEVERQLLVTAIEETKGDRPAMSRLLGLERNTLRYKLNKYGLLDKP